MHPSPDHMQFALIALSVIYVAERIWALTAKIITFFDKRSATSKKGPKQSGPQAPSETHVKLPIAAGGSLPNKALSHLRRRGFVEPPDRADDSKRKAA